jgi:molybdopterin-binding protein
VSGLTVRARVQARSVTRLNISLEVELGSVVAVVGPNGAGKTTLLRTVAGLVDPSVDSRVIVAGIDVTDDPPARRRVAYVPQQGALFPHLSVLDNVAYGLRATGVGRAKARTLATEELRRLGIDGLAGRRPRSLSGGQAQRVALARALAVDPDVLLLDEPTASLDAVGRTEVQSLLRHHLRGFRGATLMVTHDPAEALTIASRVVVLSEGLVTQDAPPDELVRSPGSRWVAHLLNLNSWTGRVATSTQVALTEGGILTAPELPAEGTPVMLSIPPTAITLFRAAPASSARNIWPVRVAEVHALGGRVRVALDAVEDTGGPAHVVAEVTSGAVADLGIAPGVQLWATVKATDLGLRPMP